LGGDEGVRGAGQPREEDEDGAVLADPVEERDEARDERRVHMGDKSGGPGGY